MSTFEDLLTFKRGAGVTKRLGGLLICLFGWREFQRSRFSVGKEGSKMQFLK